MKKVLRVLVLVIAFAVNCNFLFGDYIPETKNVLVIHSYSATMKWVEEMNAGIKEVINNEHSQKIIVTYEFLDAKRYNSEKYFKHFSEALSFKYNSKIFDAMIACDDHAFDFCRRFGNDFLPEVPLFFCGVNDIFQEVDESIYKGIYEENPLIDNFKLILKLLPDAKKIIVVADHNTRTNSVYRRRIETEIIPRFPEVDIEIVKDLPFIEIEGFLVNLPEDIVVFYLSYIVDSNGDYFPHVPIATRLLRRCSSPIFTMNNMYLDLNVIGGYLTDPFAQGKAVMILVSDYLRGVNYNLLNSKDYELDELFPLVVNSDMIDQFNISEKLLPVEAELRSSERSYQRNQEREILYAFIIIGILLLFAGYMLVLDMRSRKLKREFESKAKSWNMLIKDFPIIVLRIGYKNKLELITKNTDFIKKFSENEISNLIKDVEDKIYHNDLDKDLQINRYDDTFCFKIFKDQEKKNFKKGSLIFLVDSTEEMLAKKRVSENANNVYQILEKTPLATAILFERNEDIYIEFCNEIFSKKFNVKKDQLSITPLKDIVPTRTKWFKNSLKAIKDNIQINWIEDAEDNKNKQSIYLIQISNKRMIITIRNVTEFFKERDSINKEFKICSKELERLKKAQEIYEKEKEAINVIYRKNMQMSVLGEFFLTFNNVITKKIKDLEVNQKRILDFCEDSMDSPNGLSKYSADNNSILDTIKTDLKAVNLICSQEETATFDVSLVAAKFSEVFASLFESNNIDLSIDISGECKCRGNALELLHLFLIILNNRLTAFNRISDMKKSALVSIKKYSQHCIFKVTSGIQSNKPDLFDTTMLTEKKETLKFKGEDINMMRNIVELSFSGKLKIVDSEFSSSLIIEFPVCLI